LKSKIVIAEDQTIVRKGLRSLLESDEHIEVVAEAGDGIETIKCVEQPFQGSTISFFFSREFGQSKHAEYFYYLFVLVVVF